MKRILIANRGEIACRIIKAARALGIETVAVYSEADENALFVERADQAVKIGPAPASESYLRVEALLEAASQSGADAVHPGYGFLAENATFAQRVRTAGLTWIGPEPKSIDDMGDKERAREIARAAGVPILPGSERFSSCDPEAIQAAARMVGFPLLVKACAGGGGIGMQRVDDPAKLLKAVESTQSAAKRGFGDDHVYFERYVPRARHVEIQIFGLGDGRAFHLFERDCSVQRRFQKIIEESPAPNLPADMLERMAQSARDLASVQNYSGAGTVEFLVDAETTDFYFLEMNTRIQVEHAVTELICDVDLVGMQIRHAGGEDLEKELSAIKRNGAALECRLYAENPARRFLPAPGTLETFRPPAGMDKVRIDTGVRQGDRITPYYDPMIAKLIAWGEDRGTAVERAITALHSFEIGGLATNREFLLAVLRENDFRRGDVSTGYIDAHPQILMH